MTAQPAQSPQPVIEIASLGFSFGRVQVLRDISVNVERGEYLSIIGPNGAGKTTLLKCINRILTGAAGEIRVMGRPLAAYRQAELARLVGYVPQAGGRVFPFSVYELVLMGRYPYLSPFTSVGRRDRDAVDRSLEVTRTAGLARRRYHTLSGGERQRVQIAAALAQEGDILLLDEPTTFLDPHHQAEIFEILHRVNAEQGVSVLAVTHDVNSAALSSHRILALREGACAYLGPADGVMNNETLSRLYGKDFLFVSHPLSGRPMIVPEGAASLETTHHHAATG